MSLRSQLTAIARDLVLNTILAGGWYPRRLRAELISALTDHRVDSSATICPRLFLGAFSGLTIGPGSFINYGCFFDLGAPTVIGRDVAVGYESMFITCTHGVGDSWRRAGSDYVAPVTVENGAWLGARVIVLPGVTIGAGAVIGAGGIVVKDCEPNTLYVGAPASPIRDLRL